MGSAEPIAGRSRDAAAEPMPDAAAAQPAAAPAPQLLLRLQQSAGNVAVTRLVSGAAPAAGAPRPPQPTPGDARVSAGLADTARVRNALAPPPVHPADLAAADPPVHPADLAAAHPPVHPADLAAADLDAPRPRRHAAPRQAPRPASPAPAPDPQAAQLEELRARAPELARELVDAALGPRGQVAAYRALAEPRVPGEERAIAAALQDAADPAAADQALSRLVRSRMPALAAEIEEQALKDLTWEQLNEVGARQTPGFDAGILIREVRGAIEGWGTDEKRLFKALEGHTPLQVAAMRKAYLKTYGDEMDEDIADELSGSEEDRAKALLSGDPVLGAVATLRDAMDGAGTDEDTIMQTLRGRSAAERAAIAAAYEKTYGRPLKGDLAGEMGGYELGQADALLAGDTTKADAMALKDAMSGAGTDEPAIHAVYARIRDEVESQAAAKGMRTAQVEAEIKRRTAQLETVYGRTFDASLKEDFGSELSGGELNLALAEQAGDRTAMDAATLQIEHQSAWTSDDKVNEVLEAQYQRAEREVMRDLSADFQRQAAGLPREQREAAWQELQDRGRRIAQERGKQHMAALRSSYGALGFDVLIDTELSGYSKQEARERIAAGGKLSDAKELKYAILGAGTNERTIRETLKGKSKAELERLSKAYAQLTGNDLLSDLRGDLSGRDEADMTILLETGDATPAERAAGLDQRTRWELDEGTGEWGALADDEEARVLAATNREAQAAYEEYARLPEGDPRRKAAQARLEHWLGYGSKDIDRHREELDSITDTIAMVGAITVGIAATILSGGAAGVALLAAYFATTTAVVAAGVGAIAAAGASIIIKEKMKGAAYGGEDIATDVAVQTANAVVMVATAGMGEAAIQALGRTPAFAVLSRAAEGGVLARVGVKAAGSGLEGLVQGLPTGMLGAILNEETWRSPNPLGAILHAGGRSALESAGMAAGIGAGLHGIAEGIREPAADAASEPRDFERNASDPDAELDLLIGELGPAEEPHVTDLWDGTIIDRDPPLTAEEAERIYSNTIADSAGREAMVWKNLDTGECVVIQGNAKGVKPSLGALEELFGDAGKRGTWRPVRHYHAVDASGLTPLKYRYPSGIGGDMSAARRAALADGRLHLEMLDIVTENGREQVFYGYDPEAGRYLVGRPTTGGPGPFESFAKLDEYHEWVERETGERLEVLGRAREPMERNAADPPNVDDGWDEWGGDTEEVPVDPIPELPEAEDAYQAAQLLQRYPTAAQVREAAIRRLSALGHGMDPADLPASYIQVVESMKSYPGEAHAKAAALLPIVAGGLRNPALYAEVMVDAFEAMRANAEANPDVNRALVHLALRDGHGMKVIPRKYGTSGEFFAQYAGTPFHIVDLPFLNFDHGSMTHLLQDLVVNKAFELAGIGFTSAEFRALLQQCDGLVDNVTLEPIDSGNYTMKVGQAAWEETYDLTDEGLNRPENIRPILRELFGLQ